MAADESDYAQGVWHPSGNFWTGTDPTDGQMPLTHIVLHGTAGSMPGCLNWLCRPNGDSSAHYLVDRTGIVYQMVRESDVAWANGVVSDGGTFPASPNPNRFTLSIETENDSDNSLPHTPAQHAAVVALIADMRRRHGPLKLIPHSAIDPINRQFCPGPKIDLAAIDKEATVPTPSKPAPAPLVLLPAPVWDQKKARDDDEPGGGILDPERYRDCGFAVTAMNIRACGGPALAMGDVREKLGVAQGVGEGRDGRTTAEDVVQATELYGYHAHDRHVDLATLKIEVVRANAARSLCAVLGYWVDPAVLHWILVRGSTTAQVAIIDPWGGRTYTRPWSWVSRLYGGAQWGYVRFDDSVKP